MEIITKNSKYLQQKAKRIETYNLKTYKHSLDKHSILHKLYKAIIETRDNGIVIIDNTKLKQIEKEIKESI